eukprot:CAMPEP_0179368834 /NCGR_PEP_ID=MMETSP0797-20121207/84312_1 /TAXON_ID=47934 /ORGANISM="Dinophysis acuminata, Strain DAEP01" /LENGTH=68 /DNA_ID=CAMNT_0021084463 /DNA_START=1 /DNA_END=204 /DNA_ORIENTATION=-
MIEHVLLQAQAKNGRPIGTPRKPSRAGSGILELRSAPLREPPPCQPLFRRHGAAHLASRVRDAYARDA